MKVAGCATAGVGCDIGPERIVARRVADVGTMFDADAEVMQMHVFARADVAASRTR